MFISANQALLFWYLNFSGERFANSSSMDSVWLHEDKLLVFPPEKSWVLNLQEPSHPIEIIMVISVIKSFSFSQIKVKNRHPQVSMENQWFIRKIVLLCTAQALCSYVLVCHQQSSRKSWKLLTQRLGRPSLHLT